MTRPLSANTPDAHYAASAPRHHDGLRDDHGFARSPTALALTAAPQRRMPMAAPSLLYFAAILALLALFVTPAQAGPRGAAFQSHLIETGSVYAPRGFTELCERRPEFCAAERAAADTDPAAQAMASMFGRRSTAFQPPVWSKARMEVLRRVNAAVNASIRPVADRGADRWELNASHGDCEEYVLMKRELLARLGWPRSALRITVVRDSQGYHAILVAETSKGGYVLDNMTQRITTVKDSPYQFVVSQSVETPGAWVRVNKR